MAFVELLHRVGLADRSPPSCTATAQSGAVAPERRESLLAQVPFPRELEGQQERATAGEGV
eukprot:15461901-Alexandrium_andersonii.AAC.1